MPADSDPSDGPKCGDCGADILLKVLVPHHVWEWLRPKHLATDIRLCAVCTVRRLEKHVTGRGKVWLEVEETERCLGQPPAPVEIKSEDPDFSEQLSRVIRSGDDYVVTHKSGLRMSGGSLSLGKYDGYCKGCPKCKPESAKGEGMSLSLDLGTTPEGVEVKASSDGHVKFWSPKRTDSIDVSMEDFVETVIYALTNTDLRPGDPRLRLMDRLARMSVVEGYNGPGTRRLEVQ